MIYESRLELAQLLLADFDKSVRRIIAQPFLLSTQVDGVRRKHVPDYLLITGNGPVVVDVKPRSRWADPAVAATLCWTRAVVESRSWRYEVFGEPPDAMLANVQFLAGYRRDWLFDGKLLDDLRAEGLGGRTLEQAFQSLPQLPEPTVRAAVLHLLWRQELTVDITRSLSPNELLRVPA